MAFLKIVKDKVFEVKECLDQVAFVNTVWELQHVLLFLLLWQGFVALGEQSFSNRHMLYGYHRFRVFSWRVLRSTSVLLLALLEFGKAGF